MVKRNLRDSYKYYKQLCEGKADIKDYLEIAQGYLQFMMSKVIEGNDIQLANGNSFGVLAVRGKKPKLKYDESGKIVTVPIDMRKTKELREKFTEAKEKGTTVYFSNEHSNGKIFSFVWIRDNIRTPGNDIYVFKATKGVNGNSRKLSKAIFAGTEYLNK